jgi:hypothetical protein
VPFRLSVDGGFNFESSITDNFLYHSAPQISDLYPKFEFENSKFYLYFTGNFGNFQKSAALLCRVGDNSFAGMVVRFNLAVCYVQSLSIGAYQVGVSMNGQDLVFHDKTFKVHPLTRLESISPNVLLAVNREEQLDILVSADKSVWDLIQSYSSILYLNSTKFSCNFSRLNLTYGIFSSAVNSLVPGNYVVKLQIQSLGTFSIIKNAYLNAISPPVVTSITPEMISSSSSSLVTLSGKFQDYASLTCVFSLSSDRRRTSEVNVRPVYANYSMVVCEFSLSIFHETIGKSKPSYAFVGLSLYSSSIFFGGIVLMLPPEVTAFSPAVVIAGAQSTVLFKGHFYHISPIYGGQIGSENFNAFLVDENTLSCQISVSFEGNYFVSITIDGFHYIPAPNSLVVMTMPYILMQNYPYMCRMSSDVNLLTVYGSGFSSFTEWLYCLLNGKLISPLNVSDQEVVCPCPHYSAPLQSLTKEPIGDTFSLILGNSDTVLFSADVAYFDLKNISMSEKFVYRELENFLTVTFETLGSVLSSLFLCTFRAPDLMPIVRAPLFTSENSLSCALTPVDINDTVNFLFLDIGINNATAVEVGYLSVVSLPVLNDISPRFGSEIGDYPVEFYVSKLISELGVSCVFGTFEVPAKVFLGYDSTVLCMAPPMPPGQYSVAVKFDNVVSNNLPLEIFETFKVLGSSPDMLYVTSLGSVKFEFSHVGDSTRNATFHCRIKEIPYLMISASKISSTGNTVTCYLAGIDVDIGEYQLLLFMETSYVGSHNFWVASAPTILDVNPSNVRVGMIANIVVKVENLPSAQVYCLFDSLETVAQVIDSRHVVCPTLSITDQRQVSFTLRFSDYGLAGNRLQFNFYSEVSVDSIFPYFGSVAGETLVTVTGRYFQPNLPYMCVFGSHLVPSQYISPTQLSCYSPTSKPTVVNFYIFIDGNNVAVSNATIVYTFSLDPNIVKVVPSTASIYGT